MNFRVKKRIDKIFNNEFFINKMYKNVNDEFTFYCYNKFDYTINFYIFNEREMILCFKCLLLRMIRALES